MFAIRMKSTGYYLPVGPGASYWTGDEPAKNPRLFISPHAARAFKASWAKGEAHIKRRPHSNWAVDEIEDLVYVDKGRNQLMLEIIPVTLTFGEPL